MEALRSSKISVTIYHTTKRNIPEDFHFKMFVISYSEVDIYNSQWIFIYSNFKIFLENNVKSAVSVNISCCEWKVLQMEYTKAWHSLACSTSTTQWMWNPSLGPNFTDSDMMERLA